MSGFDFAREVQQRESGSVGVLTGRELQQQQHYVEQFLLRQQWLVLGLPVDDCGDCVRERRPFAMHGAREIV